MADFLTRLAERTLGVAPLVQPIIAPVFAPEPQLAGETHLLQREDASAVQPIVAPEPAPASEARRLQRENLSLDTTHDEMLPAEDRSSPTTSRISRRHPINSATSERSTGQSSLEHSQELHARPEHLKHVLKGASPEQENLTRHSAPAPDTTAVPSSTTLVPPPNDVSLGTSLSTNWTSLSRALPSVQHLEASAAEKSAPAPTIRVTIGRIEVRAVMPAKEPAARPPSTRPGPRLSLDDYLKQQHGGQR